MFFRCASCRRKHGTNEYLGDSNWSRGRGMVDRVELTGHERGKDDGHSGGRSTNRERQYECLDCGHLGWSRHLDLAKAASKNQPPADAPARKERP